MPNFFKSFSNKELLRWHKSQRGRTTAVSGPIQKEIKEEIARRKAKGTIRKTAGKSKRKSTGFGFSVPKAPRWW